jgi:hypothetical protein
MLVVQALAQAWDAPASSHEEDRIAPGGLNVGHAVEVLRCDRGARAESRRRRAIAKLLAHDWDGERSTKLLVGLGLANAEAINRLKELTVREFSEAAFALHARDLDWLEYAVLRHLTTADQDVAEKAAGAERFALPSPGIAYAAGPPSCWRPESPSTYHFLNPYFELTAHVSVDAPIGQVEKNVDAQNWNVCGRFWNPPPNALNPTSPPDGAYFTPATWPSNTCTFPGPFPPDPPASTPPPGTIYRDPRYLFEQFFFPLPIGNTMFSNILAIWTFPTTTMTTSGIVQPMQQLDYRLGNCGIDNIHGAIGGSVGNQPMTTVYDQGHIQVWSDGSRTHVASVKDAQFSGRGMNWLTQLNPALRELNDQLGELACCLK